ncbi:PorV/PorQ family protein, partial [bacterium]|nr:PorV/PorQ family protein [bacterium]
MKKKKHSMLSMLVICFLWVLWSSGQTVLAAQEEFLAAQSGNAFLDIGTGARAVAMGEAFTGIADDVSSIYWNPAGLGQVKNLQILLMHNQWFQDVLYEYGAFGVPVLRGVFGLSVTYVNYGSMDRLDELGQTSGSFTAYDLNISAAYGREFSDNFLAGVGMKLPFTNIDDETQVSLAADFGMLYKVPGFETLQIGLNIMNLGTRVGKATQPSQVKLGLGLVEAIAGLKAGVDIGKRLFEDSLQVNVGAEYLLMDILAPRIGYKITTEESGLGIDIVGLTVGLGLRHKVRDFSLGLDYAYVPYGDLGNTHRIALMLESGVSSTAQSARAVSQRRSTSGATPAVRVSEWRPSASKKPAASRRVKAALLPPKKVILKKAGSRIKVIWTSSPSPQRYGYNVYMKTGKKGKYYKLNSSLLRTNSYTVKKLKLKRAYYFIVKT